MSKNKDKKEPKVEQTKNQKDPKDLKIDQLEQSLSSLTKENDELKHKLTSYEKQIQQINEEYVKKVTEKAKQASELIDQKTNEIKQKLTEEFNNKSKFALEKVAIQIINVVNQFELALSHTPNDPKILNYQKGFNMFLTMLKGLLSDINVAEINVKIGGEFNPNQMECFETQHSDEINDNHVMKVIKKGYKLHERVIVPALVIVCKKSN
ncbi:MAG: nucleotide exchange factor GrpE [Mycoplasmoidaceae bacterium]|nr:nucleotide exchange factor GrpE [Mycoplasmoidaceae bacterium]